MGGACDPPQELSAHLCHVCPRDNVLFPEACAFMPQELICRIRILLDAGAVVEGSAAQRQLDRHVRSFMTVSR